MSSNAPSTTSGGRSGSRLSPIKINNYKRTKRVNVFVGRFDQNGTRFQLGVFPELAKHFSPKWKQELLEKNGLCTTAYADKDANETEKTCVRFVIQWIEQAGSDYTGTRAISYPNHNVQILQTLRALVNELQIGLLLDRIDKDISRIVGAENRRVQKAAAFAALKEEQDNKPVFCELCKDQGHRDRRCPYAASYKGRCFKCRGINHKSDACTARADLSQLEVADTFDSSKTVREERAKLWALKEAKLAKEKARLPPIALIPAPAPAPVPLPGSLLGAETEAEAEVEAPISNSIPASREATSQPISMSIPSPIPAKAGPQPDPLPKPSVAPLTSAKADNEPSKHTWQPTRATATLKNQHGKQKSLQLKSCPIRIEMVDGVEIVAVRAEGRIPKAAFEANVLSKQILPDAEALQE